MDCTQLGHGPVDENAEPVGHHHANEIDGHHHEISVGITPAPAAIIDS